MTVQERNDLIGQVLEVVRRQEANENYPYYGDFIRDCNKYGLTEEDFNKQILLDATQLYDGPVEPTTGPNCKIFGERCYSLKQMGTQFFKFPAKSEAYMADVILFKEDVRKLEDSDRTMELVEIFNSETNLGKRYFRVLYHLNPTLEYRIEAEMSEDLDELLQKGFEDYDFYTQIVKHFNVGFLQIWLEETAPKHAVKLTEGKGYIDFLNFIYAVDLSYPFYFDEELYLDPADLVSELQKNFAFREVVYEHLEDGELQAWFNGMGEQEWVERYASVKSVIEELPYYEESEKKQAVIQALIQILDPEIHFPEIVSAAKEINLQNIEASTMLKYPVAFKLQNFAFLKADISMDQQYEGIRLDKGILAFNSFTDSVSETIFLEIDPLKLVKDKEYTFQLQITSFYQSFSIPVKLRVVFPKQAYIRSMIKYGVFGLIYFFSFRILLELLTDNQPRDYMFYSRYTAVYYNLPENYYIYIILLLLLVIGIWQGYRFSKKTEKI